MYKLTERLHIHLSTLLGFLIAIGVYYFTGLDGIRLLLLAVIVTVLIGIAILIYLQHWYEEE